MLTQFIFVSMNPNLFSIIKALFLNLVFFIQVFYLFLINFIFTLPLAFQALIFVNLFFPHTLSAFSFLFKYFVLNL
jgi:hypothetical protein